MTLPLPNLDDRRFQDLVDDAKRMVQQRCPEWSDHNVSDPGVTLIETFAFVVDQLLFRLNRVPDKLYLAFLDLIGVRPHAPTAARTEATFWLSAPQLEAVLVGRGTQLSTLRTEHDDAVVFETLADLSIPPRTLAGVATQGGGDEVVMRARELRERSGFDCFAAPPMPGDAVLFALDDAAPRCAVALRFDCEVQGAGVHPDFPPLRWQAWTGNGWAGCELDRDGTGGLNRAGDVVVHVPATHVASTSGGMRAGWLRCLVVPPEGDYPAYRVSPVIRSVEVFTIGGSIPVLHAEVVGEEVIGLSEGIAGQRFPLAHQPVVDDGHAMVVEVAGGAGWDTWEEVTSFADRSPDERVFRVDRAAGVLEFAPAVREPDGLLRAFGAVPPKGAPLRVPEYRFGGGPRGNVAIGALSVLRTSIPYVERVQNRYPAVGGVAGETMDEVRRRGPLDLRTRDRAVTAEDFEVLALRSSPGLARVRCIPEEQSGARLLVVPGAPREPDGTIRFEDLVPSEELLEVVTQQLDQRRVVGTRLVVEPPFYQGITVVARLTARPRADVEALRVQALHGLFTYFDPLSGGPDGTGWPFGRPVQTGEVYAVLQRLAGTELVDDVKLFAADPLTGVRADPVGRVELGPQALVFSFGHQVRVTKGA